MPACTVRLPRAARFAALLLLGWVTPATAADENAAPVAVARPESVPIVEQLSVNGTVTAKRAASLSADVSGRVIALPVDAGDAVEAGDALLRLDAELASLALENARAAAARARAEHADAERRLDEARELAREQNIAASELRSREAEAAMAAASLAEAKAAAAEQAAVVERHEISAPFKGVIAARHVELGEWVEPGGVVFDLVSMNALRFDFRVPQELFPKISRDTNVALSVNALPGKTFAGRIEAIVPVSNVQTRDFLLRVVSDEMPAAVTPGMSARAVLKLDTGRHGVTVSRDALLRHPDGRSTVWIVEETDEGPVARERRVETGLAFDGRIEIRSGLAADAMVIERGNEALEDGQRVRVTESGRNAG